jgi:hypothetical protein
LTGYDAIVLLSFVVFFGCIVIGWVLVATTLPANDDDDDELE